MRSIFSIFLLGLALHDVTWADPMEAVGYEPLPGPDLSQYRIVYCQLETIESSRKNALDGGLFWKPTVVRTIPSILIQAQDGEPAVIVSFHPIAPAPARSITNIELVITTYPAKANQQYRPPTWQQNSKLTSYGHWRTKKRNNFFFSLQNPTLAGYLTTMSIVEQSKASDATSMPAQDYAAKWDRGWGIIPRIQPFTLNRLVWHMFHNFDPDIGQVFSSWHDGEEHRFKPVQMSGIAWDAASDDIGNGLINIQKVTLEQSATDFRSDAKDSNVQEWTRSWDIGSTSRALTRIVP